jgi:riboflavin kinase/FMN adenylyltransferase
MAIARLNWDDPPPVFCRQGALAIGNFDGVHRGHAALLGELRSRASAVTGPAVALTFDPHPLQLLRPADFQPLLTTANHRAELLQTSGADHVVILTTTRELLHLSPEEFFDQVIRSRLQARALVEGVNFGFGRERRGNVAMLTRLCEQAGISFAVVPPLQQEGVPVSSSRVRNALLRGEVRAAAVLLGRPYRLRGTVASGQKRGRTLGFPTANLEDVETLVPGDGVYAVRAHQAGSPWPGAANIGPNPTFGEKTRKVEVHLIDFDGDLLGQQLAVDFVDRLRDTRPFAGPAQLVEQLRADVAQARRIVDAAG